MRTSTPITPTPAATPGSICGNGAIDQGEQCDGEAVGHCPSLCLEDCTCPDWIELPLEGWSRLRGSGTFEVVENDPEIGSPALITETSEVPSEKFVIAYPPEPTLGVSFPILSVTIRDDDRFSVEVLVRTRKGASRVLTYVANDSVPTVRGLRAMFPLGAGARVGAFRTSRRNLAADLQAAFGMSLVTVEQVRLLGDLSASRIVLAAEGPAGSLASEPASIRVPLSGWTRRGRGLVYGDEYDPALGAETMRAEASEPASRFQLSYPPAGHGELLASYRALSLLVRDERHFAIEVKVKTSEGRSHKLRYRSDVTVAKIGRRKSTLPLLLTPLAEGPYRRATLDLARDLQLGDPRVTQRSVLAVRLIGRFQVGEVRLTDRVE